MTPQEPNTDAQADDLTYAFAPIHKRALGVAAGIVIGSLFFVITAFHLVAHPAEGPPIELLAQYFYGYSVTWPGAFVGLFWGGVTGFVVGWLVALVRNLSVSIAVFVLKTRADLKQTADFLDHI